MIDGPENKSAEARRRRVLCIDVGGRRVGIAISDALGALAHPVETIERPRLPKDAKKPPPDAPMDNDPAVVEVARVATELEATRIVTGQPLNMDGTAGDQAERCRQFGEAVGRRCGLPVEHWDERLSSVEARGLLAGQLTGSERKRRGKRKAVLDQVAAVVILQDWLDAQG